MPEKDQQSQQNGKETEAKAEKPPILAFSEASVPREFAEAAWREVQNVLALSGQERKSGYFGNSPWKEGQYSSVDWYIAEVETRQKESRDLGFGSQLNVETLFDIYEQELRSKERLGKHMRILMLNHDINGHNVNWGFGLTDSHIGLEVVSAKRFLESKSEPELALNMWGRLVRHETGHLFGLVNRKVHAEEKLGTHCTNVCCMRQGMDMKEWRKLTEEEMRGNITFCSECQDELQRK